jgi:hypothetical protein
MSGILRKWAALGRRLAPARPVPRTDWAPARRIADAARAWFAAQAARVAALLQRSNGLLAPLGDPLLTDFGGHRWLSGDREEAYSDWLQWVLQQIGTPRAIFQLLHADEPPGLADWRGEPDVARERTVPRGHDGQKGRLDLVVRFGDLALLVLELKTGTAEAADTAKHTGYKQWIATQSAAHKDAVLIATDAESDEYDGFRFLSWAELCLGLRRLARRDCGDGRLVVAAMTLAFVGAVEQNLLGFHTPAQTGTGAINPRLPAYLDEWLARPDL